MTTILPQGNIMRVTNARGRVLGYAYSETDNTGAIKQHWVLEPGVDKPGSESTEFGWTVEHENKTTAEFFTFAQTVWKQGSSYVQSDVTDYGTFATVPAIEQTKYFPPLEDDAGTHVIFGGGMGVDGRYTAYPSTSGDTNDEYWVVGGNYSPAGDKTIQSGANSNEFTQDAPGYKYLKVTSSKSDTLPGS